MSKFRQMGDLKRELSDVKKGVASLKVQIAVTQAIGGLNTVLMLGTLWPVYRIVERLPSLERAG